MIRKSGNRFSLGTSAFPEIVLDQKDKIMIRLKLIG